MIKAIIFDLNGVFIQGRLLSERFCEKFDVSENEFVPTLKKVMSKVRLPNAGDAFNYWELYFEKWNLKLTKDEFFDFWFLGEKAVTKMIELAKGIKAKGVKVLILSNNFKERADYYQRNFPFIEEVAEKVHYSWQTGFVKPDKRTYQKLLTDNNLEAEECIYFDDSQVNIEFASSLGIKAFLFEDANRVGSILKQQGVSI